MTDLAYTAGMGLLLDQGWSALDARVLLLDAAGTYAPAISDPFLSSLDLAANELGTLSACPGYERKTISSRDVVTDQLENEAEAHGANISWTSLGSVGPTARAAVVYFHITDDTDSVPLLYFDSIFPRTLNGQDLTLQWSLEGLFITAFT